MKKIIDVRVEIDSDLDSDDIGQRIINCARSCAENTDTINLVKVYVSENTLRTEVDRFILTMREVFRNKGLDNTIFVPLCENNIKDINIEEIKITYVNS